MKLVALLSFYDEQPKDLERLVRSLPTAGVTALVALDGAYALYPNAQASSSQAEHHALRDAASAAGITLHLRIPTQPWPGNEMEKRSRLFHLAEQITTTDDWYLVIDGDEHITHGQDPKPALADTVFDVADITYQEPKADGHTTTTPAPRIFRAIRGLHCFRNHFTYHTPDGRYLWGDATRDRLEARHVAHDITIRHEHRAPHRRDQARAYYQARDTTGLEAGRCCGCNHRATRRIYWGYQPDGPGYRANVLETCATCALIFEQQGRDPLGRPVEAEHLHA